MTDFLDAHPGGSAALLHEEVAGKDATEQFYNLHRHAVIQKYSDLQVGTIQGEVSQVLDPVSLTRICLHSVLMQSANW